MNTELTARAAQAFPAFPDRIPLFLGSKISAVLAGLQQDLDDGRYLLCVTGPPGMGKTALARELHRTCGRELVSLVEQPTPDALVFDLLASFDISVPERDPAVARRRLCLALATGFHRQQPLLQIIDNGDRLTTDDLETLLHLFTRGFAQIILLGTPDFASRFEAAAQAKGLPALDRSYRLKPLPLSDTGQYIRHRLGCADLPKELFRQNAIAAVYAYSSGIPGLVNGLCSAALAATERMTASAITDVQIHAAARLAEPGTYRCIQRHQAAGSVGEAPPDPLPAVLQTQTAPPLDSRCEPTPSPRRWRQRRLGVAAAMVAAVAAGVMLVKDQLIDLSQHGQPRADLSLNEAPAKPGGRKRTPPAPTTADLPPEATPPRSAEFAALRPLSAVGDGSPAEVPTQKSDPPAPPPPGLAADTATLPVIIPADTVSAQSSPEQRAEAARLYAMRAAHELGKGDRAAARLSIERGLASDPANARLRELRRELEDRQNSRPPAATTEAASRPLPAPPPSISPDVEEHYEEVVQDAEVRLYVQLARTALDSGDPVEALAHITEGLESAPHDRTLLELRSATLATLDIRNRY